MSLDNKVLVGFLVGDFHSVFFRFSIIFTNSSGPLCSLLARADHLLSTASLGAAGSSLPSSAAEDGELSLEERLLKLHAQEAVRDTRATHLNLASNLLDR